MTDVIEIFDNDSITIPFVVTDSSGATKDLTGATVGATAKDVATGVVTNLAAALGDAAAGEINVEIVSAALDASVYRLHVTASFSAGADAQTVAERVVTVKESN